MGKPSGEFSPYEIFSFYTVWLAKRRLKQLGLYDDFMHQYHDNLKRITTRHEKIKFKNEFKKMIYDESEPYFTWERMIGMCPVCFGFWVSLTTALLFKQSFISLVAIIVISHVIIRLLNKIL